MIKEIAFKFDTGKNIYMTTRKFKRDSANLFQNNETTERYLEKFFSNVQVANQKECGIWLDVRTIMYELKIKKFKHHMRYCNFRGDRESKRSRNGENVGDGLHTAFITLIRRTSA